MARKVRAARITGPRAVGVVWVEPPACPDDGALVRVEHTGICGSDLLPYVGARAVAPHALGHEMMGRVEAIGPRVGEFRVGDRVVAEALASCGRCRWCLANASQLCESRVFVPHYGPGGLSELAVVHGSSLHAVPDSVPSDLAPLAEPLAVAMHGLARGGVLPGQAILVIGAGTIGLCSVAAARAAGVGDITLVARYAHQARTALALGATRAVASLGKFTRVVDVVVNTVPGSAAMEMAISACGTRGRVVLLGGFSAPESYLLRRVVSREIDMVGAICYDRREFAHALELLQNGQLDLRPLITHRFPLASIAQAFETALDKSSGSIKVMVDVSA